MYYAFYHINHFFAPIIFYGNFYEDFFLYSFIHMCILCLGHFSQWRSFEEFLKRQNMNFIFYWTISIMFIFSFWVSELMKKKNVIWADTLSSHDKSITSSHSLKLLVKTILNHEINKFPFCYQDRGLMTVSKIYDKKKSFN
jgi:hypothetical protein